MDFANGLGKNSDPVDPSIRPLVYREITSTTCKVENMQPPGPPPLDCNYESPMAIKLIRCLLITFL